MDQERRQEALHELLETERTYVHRLETTFKIYVQGSATILSETERASLFSNLEDILLVNATFLQQLEERFKAGPEATLGDIFLNNIPQFSVYMVYCRNHHSSIQFLQDKMKNSEFTKFIQESLTNPECIGLDLASFLLEPVQRLTRYPMLLTQIKKYSDSDSDESKFIDLAIEESEALLHRVNVSMSEGEEQYRLQKLQRRLSSHSRLPSSSFDHQSRLPANLAGLTRSFSERKLLKSGIWVKLKSRRKLIVFLFSDFLMLTEAFGGITDLEALQDDETKLKIYRAPIHLDNIWLLKEAEASKVPDSFRNNNDLRALEIEAQDLDPLQVHIKADEYEEWVEAIAAAKRRLRGFNVQSTAHNQDTVRGTLKMTIISSSNLFSEGSFYCQIQNQNGTFRYSTHPVKAPNPTWNQSFAIPIDNQTDSLEVEVFQYSQFEVNDSLGKAQIALDMLVNSPVPLNLGTTSLHMKPSPSFISIDLAFIPKK